MSLQCINLNLFLENIPWFFLEIWSFKLTLYMHHMYLMFKMNIKYSLIIYKVIKREYLMINLFLIKTNGDI